MAQQSENSAPWKQRMVRLLAVFALTAACLGSAVALVIYADTHGASATEYQVVHSQEVLLNLASVGTQLDRIDLNARLYRLDREEDHLRSAQGAAVVMNSLTDRLLTLVRDNPVQEHRAGDLNRAGQKLSAAVDRLASVVDGGLPESVLECRRVLALMQGEERTLLADRQQVAARTNLSNLLRRVGIMVIGTLLILVLFGFLMRDAVRRGRFEEQISEANAKLRSTVERLEQKALESDLLIAARDEMGLCLQGEQAEQCAVRYFGRLLPGTEGRMRLINNSRQTLENAGSWGGLENDSGPYEGFEPQSCCALRSGRTRWRRPQLSEVHCGHFAEAPPEEYLCIPLLAHGEALGVVTVKCNAAEAVAMTEARGDAVASLAEMAAMAIAGLRLRQRLESQSIHDGATGLFNRSFMEAALERELQRATRHKKPVAVMMVDVDHFKDFNDTFGHEAGDMVLREVAACLRAGVRAEDMVCRYGGEEFAIILPEIMTRPALDRAEILRQRISEITLRFQGEALRRLTISIGIAMFPEQAGSSEELLRQADLALYAAKHQGRNRVVSEANVLA